MNSTKIKFSVRNLNIYYGNFLALKNITLDIPERSITAIIGPSGCGKSTFLRALNRMNELLPNVKTEGEVLLDGKNIYSPDIDVVSLRRRVGMVFQRPNPFPKSIFENVAFGLRIQGVKSREQIEEIVELSLRRAALWDEVKNKLHKSALELSGGQQQRLCIARVLAVQPEVILMDEPASALDPIATLRIEDLMRELKEEYTIVIVTHNMQQAARVSDFTAFFLTDENRTGMLIEYGNTSEIFTIPKDPRTEGYITGRYG
ncbi:MAG: phosphate ABC transporter ATP-binding protein PstB [bacterium]